MLVWEEQVLMRFKIVPEPVRHEVVLRNGRIGNCTYTVSGKGLFCHNLDFCHKAMNSIMVVEVEFRGLVVLFTDPEKVLL